MRNALLAAAALALLGTAPAFSATIPTSPEQITGTVRLKPAGVISMAQLQTTLQDRGYRNILLTPSRPNLQNPRPDIEGNGRKVVASFDPDLTAVHRGWNGTAVLNNKRVNVVID
jgi:hypothetical protein